ncbi:MAG: cation diffusion facilitator family transporter [Actinomycetota bacterium]|nr:cation diffusion facilitator family transporter [Actinomycetota bacterium]
MEAKDIAKRKLSIFSLAVSIFLVIIKTIVAYSSNSLGVYSEALNNTLDIVTVLITFFAIRISIRPADKDHPYGHGKYENFSAFIETVIIMLLCLFIIYKSINRIINRDYALNINIYIFAALIFSIIINLIRVFYIAKIAVKYNSIAFKADLINYAGDLISSVIVIAGLVFARFGMNIADPIASIIVSLIILIFSIRLSFRTIRDLLGYIPVEITEKAEKALSGFQEIKKINNIKIQEVGNIKFINLDLSLNSSLHLSQVEEIKEKIKFGLSKEIADCEIMIDTKSDLPEENIEEVIKDIVLKEPKVKDIHNISVNNLKEGFNITLHIELKKDIKLAEAEIITKNIEDKLKNISDELNNTYIHIEVENNPEEWTDITNKSDRLIDEIKKSISDYVDIRSCHNFAVLIKEARYNISFHCCLDKDMDITSVHNMTTEMENHIKTTFKNIDELTIHAEPD